MDQNRGYLDQANRGIFVIILWNGLALIWVVVCFATAHTSSQISNAGYVEPGACAECHREVAESYARTAMARTFGAVQSENDFPELKRGAFHHDASEEAFTVYARDGRPYIQRRQIGFDGAVTNVFEARVDYRIGSGNHARSYISRTKAGELIELPITWYARNGGYWAMSPGYDRPDHAGFSRKIGYRCMSCHNGYIQTQSDALEENARFPNRLPEGIDCQRCHGPGGAHLEAARQGAPAERVRSAIINPARLSHDRQMEVSNLHHSPCRVAPFTNPAASIDSLLLNTG